LVQLYPHLFSKIKHSQDSDKQEIQHIFLIQCVLKAAQQKESVIPPSAASSTIQTFSESILKQVGFKDPSIIQIFS
jgi:hypothetical protein